MVTRGARVAASDQVVDDTGIRQPAGAAHAWEPGTNQTLCGEALSRTRLLRFPHVGWASLSRDPPLAVEEVCRRCLAATGTRRDDRPWQRLNPRP